MKINWTLMILVLSFAFIAKADIIKVRSSEEKNQTRLVLELVDKKKYKIFQLDNPPRLVIDVKNSKILNKEKFNKNISNTYIKNIRYGINNNDLRIVLDLRKDSFKYKSSSIPKNNKYGYRIVVDFEFDKVKTEKKEIIKITDKKNKVNEIPKTFLSENNSSVENNTKLVLESNNSNKTLNQKIDKTEQNISQSKEELSLTSKELNNNQKVDKVIKLKTNKKNNEKTNSKRLYTIVIDPGHGGEDSGTIGTTYNTFEKNITLSYAKELKKALEKTNRYNVYLTRNSDIYLSLMTRRHKARKYKADIFISLHADASPNPEISGASVYTLSNNAYDQESKILSEKENKSDIIDDIDLAEEKKDIANLLIDLIRRDTTNVSAKLAHNITKELSKEINMLKKAHRFAGFKVLKGVDIPAILIELGYLSNKDEEELLRTPNYRTKIVNALSVAISNHFDAVKH